MAKSSRRGLLAGAALLSMGGAATAVITVSPDTELLNLCERYLATVGLSSGTVLASRRDADPSWHTAVAISRIPARTQAGVQAKARVMHRYLQDAYGHPEPKFCADAEMAAMWSLVNDLLGGRVA